MLEVNHVTLSYTDTPVLTDVSFSLEEGKIYAVLGPNGCGKTTLLRGLTRSLKPQQGEIRLLDRPLSDYGTKELARITAILHQETQIGFEMTVRDLVSYGRFAHRDWWRGRTEQDEAIIDDALLKTNLEALQERDLATLSGGERRRAWLALCLAQRPRLLLLDEPTNHLDIAHQLDLLKLIQRLNQEDNLTILMVLHDINHALRNADEILLLDSGRLRAKGTPNELLQEGLIQDVFGVDALVLEDQDDRPLFFATNVSEG